MKKRKTLLTWAGIVCFLYAAVYIYCLVVISFNFGNIIDVIKQMVNDTYPMLGENYLSLIKTYMIVVTITNVVFGIIYLVYSRYTDTKFKKSKTSLVVLMIINILFGLNLISLVLLLIAIATKTEEPELNENTVSKNNEETDAFYDMAAKVTKLKNQLNNGEISESQYKVELAKIVNGGKTNNNNSVTCEFCGSAMENNKCSSCGATNDKK